MEKIRTTLLISDDLDDHQSFTEAFQKVSPSMVVIAVLSQDKAMDLLMSRKLIPDYVFLDVSSPDSNVSKFLAKVKMAEDGKKISVTVYGGEDDSFLSREVDGVSQFDKDYEFPQLIKFFENLLDQRDE
jgi:response regulator RpfG family c-di-GMP phosphodiesterase